MLKKSLLLIAITAFFFNISIGNAKLIKTVEVDLIKAVQNNDAVLAEKLIKQGANPNIIIPYTSDNPLLIAVSNENLGLVEVLVKNGADPNLFVTFENQSVSTPLLRAIQKQNLEIVQTLVEAGAKIDYSDEDLEDIKKRIDSPLLASVKKFQPENGLAIFQYLLSKGANINYACTKGITPLIAAASYEDDEGREDMHTIAKELLSCGADRNLKDKQNKTALEHATMLKLNGMEEILKADLL